MKVEKINKIIVENSWYKDLYEYRILKQTIFFIVIWAILCFYLIINAYTNEAFIISIILSIFAFSTFILMLHSLRKYVINPAHELYEMVVDVRQGKRAEIYQSPEDNLFSKLIQEFNQLGNEYAQITIDIDSHVQKQTARLAQKNASLKILYDVAASINQADDLDELLKRFLRILKEMTDAQAATVRLLFDDNTMHLVSCIGIDNEIITSLPSQPLDSQQLKTMISAGYLCQNNPDNSFENIGKHIHNIESLELISVPLQYHGKILGIYNLFVSKDGLSKREDIIELLISIGRHLGMAIEDFHLDNESQRLSLHEERTHLANEIHDSLAQTIASLRFQIRILSEMLQQEQYQDSANAVEKIKNSIDEANSELRELISHFRAPVDKRGLIPTLKELVEKFKQDTNISTYFQLNCQHSGLSAIMEVQVLRIIQECFSNIKKHSQAHIVRLLLTSTQDGHYKVLLEDDGVGFGMPIKKNQPGQQIGLTIMQERAKKLGGEFRIESEAGEGTRIELEFIV